MANEKLIEISSKVVKGEASDVELQKMLGVLEILAQRGANNPQVHYEINEIITRTANEILKPRLDILNYIANTQRVGNGQKIEFNVPQKTKMKMQFSSRGTTVDYQRVQNSKKYTAEPKVIKGGAYYDIDQLLSGTVTGFVGVVNALVEDMENKISAEVIRVLHTAMADAPAANRWTGANITSADFDKVASIIKRYSPDTVCVGDIDFVNKVSDFITSDWASNSMKDRLNEEGRFLEYKGTRIIPFTNPFAEDDTDNTVLAAPRQYAYIFPAGAEKPVNIGFEGDLLQLTKTDIESERVFLKVSQKVAVTAFTDLRNIGEYNDTSLA